MSLTTLLMSNNAGTTLASPVGIGATTLTLATGTGGEFPTPDGSGNQFFPLTLIDQSAGIAVNEITYCTARSGDVCTVMRGQEGTAQRNWSVGDVAANLLTAGILTYVGQPTTGFITASSTDTLTNKTMSGSSNSFSNIPATAIVGTLPVSHGGTGLTAVGSASTVLGSNGTTLSWVTNPAATFPILTGITAATTSGAAPLMIVGYNQVDTAAGGSNAVKFPSAVASGSIVWVYNRTGGSINLYPSGSGTVYWVSNDAGSSSALCAEGTQQWLSIGSDNWVMFSSTGF